MKIIDFDKKGNVVRFYLGDESDSKYHGDDWDDSPYEHNAGIVYSEYIKGHVDIAFPYDYAVLEPCDGEYNSRWSKDDMKSCKVPCIIIVPPDVLKNTWSWDCKFTRFIGSDMIKKYYFGDVLDEKSSNI